MSFSATRESLYPRNRTLTAICEIPIEKSLKTALDSEKFGGINICKQPENYDFAGINFRERPKNLRKVLPAKLSTFKVVRILQTGILQAQLGIWLLSINLNQSSISIEHF